MLDPALVRDRPEAVREMLRARAVDFDLDSLIRHDRMRRDLMARADELRRSRNRMARQVAERKRAGGGDDGGGMQSILDEMKGVSAELARLRSEQDGVEETYRRLASTVPNMVHESVPVGADESANVEVRRWGDARDPGPGVTDHIDVAQSLDLIDLERAAKVAGARFYYLKNGLVRLNQALINFALDFLGGGGGGGGGGSGGGAGYTLVQPPYMINRESMEGAVIADDFEQVIYKVQDEDLYMIGTSEHAMAAMHSQEIIGGAGLPIRYAGVSPCFRKEAGAHGRDQKGIFRVHQFDKVEQFVFCRPEDSWNEHERMLATAERFYQSLGIPYRVMLLSTGDMGKVSAKTYDIEAWMAGQNAYREVVSCSNCLDYQARRLKIRFRDRTNDDTRYLHTLNSTLVATTRVMVAIMENFQTGDGHVSIPPVLRGYMGGQKEI